MDGDWKRERETKGIRKSGYEVEGGEAKVDGDWKRGRERGNKEVLVRGRSVKERQKGGRKGERIREK